MPLYDLYVTNTLGNICTEALALLNVVDDEASVPAEDMARAAKQLQLMLQTWGINGPTIWMRREVEFSTVASTPSYDLVTDAAITTEHIVAVGRYESGEDVRSPLTPLSREAYIHLSDRTTEGPPTYYWPQFTSTDQDITFWPVPDAIYDIKVDYRLSFTNQDERTDVIELPYYFIEAAIWCLADRLIVPFGKANTAEAKIIIPRAYDLYATAAAVDVIQDGGGEVQFSPARR